MNLFSGPFKQSTGFIAAALLGDGVDDLLENSVIRLFSGTMPKHPDQKESGTLLCTLAKDVPSAPWVGKTKATGLITWMRICDKDDNGDDSASAIRLDKKIHGVSIANTDEEMTIVGSLELL